MAVAQPVGKGQLVPVRQLHFESVLPKGHGDLWGEGGCGEAGGPGNGPGGLAVAQAVPTRV